VTANGRAYDVLIAGAAAFSAAGAGGQSLLSAATAGTQPFSRQPLAHTRAGASGPEVYAAHCPPPPVAELLGARGVRTLCYEARMFASAGVAALRAAGWPPGAAEMVVCGTVNTGLDDLDAVLDETEREGAERVNPAWAVQVGFVVGTARLSMAVEATGPCLTVSSGRCAGMEALSIAADALQDDQAAGVLAGGVDVLSHAGVSVFDQRIRVPPRPFDRDRAGAVPGEAAAVLALCRADRAIDGVRSQTRLVAHASAADLIAGAGGLAGTIQRAIDCALDQVNWRPEELGLVISSACGDMLLDRCEAEGLAAAVGPEVPVWTVHGHTGLTAGADGPLQVIAAVTALREGCVPPVAGLTTFDPSLPLIAALRPAPVPPRTPRALCLTVDISGRADVVLLANEGA
jgi:3-oxoacyl-[acyl-carrier-protein] synthase II